MGISKNALKKKVKNLSFRVLETQPGHPVRLFSCPGGNSQRKTEISQARRSDFPKKQNLPILAAFFLNTFFENLIGI